MQENLASSLAASAFPFFSHLKTFPLKIPPPRQPAGETSDQMNSISPQKKLQTGKTSLGISSGQRKEKKKTGWGKKEKLNLSFPLLGFQFDIFLLPTC